MDTWFYETAISRRVRRVLNLFAPLLTPQGFYLAEGTAVALLYGHRRSVDLDWFLSGSIDPTQLLEIIQQRGVPFTASRIAPDTLIGWSLQVKVSMFGYPYPLLEPPVVWESIPVMIASPKDLLSMKLSAVLQRGAKRDFIDLYVLLQEFSLTEGLELFKSKYGFVETVSMAHALTYFDDADAEPTPVMIKPIRWRTVKQFFRQQVRSLWGDL